MPTGNPGPYLSTLQAATTLGVSVSTVKRWVDEGVLPAHRTAGGHRKLLRAEVLALARQGDLPRGDLASLSLASCRDQAVDLEATEAALLEALLGRQGADASAIVRRAYDSGVAVETIADRVIAPAMAKVGHQWDELPGRADLRPGGKDGSFSASSDEIIEPSPLGQRQPAAFQEGQRLAHLSRRQAKRAHGTVRRKPFRVKVPETGIEPALPVMGTRPSTWRVCQFRHSGATFSLTIRAIPPENQAPHRQERDISGSQAQGMAP
jgi:excisionase family DNA binding protein